MIARIASAVLLVGVGLAWAARPGASHAATPAAEHTEARFGPSAFDSIKSLAGEWGPMDDRGIATGQVTTRFRVTAAGNAVVETIFPDTEREMVTVYYLDQSELHLTHYCVLGNRPHMTARPGENGAIDFACDDTSCCDDQTSMVAASFQSISADRLTALWHGVYEDGTGFDVPLNLARIGPAPASAPAASATAGDH